MSLCKVIQFKPKEVRLDDPKEITRLTYYFSDKYKLRADIVASLIWQESKGDIWAQRYELGFYKRYIEGKGRNELSGFVPPNFPTLITEKVSRSVSWGCCQLMGETLRFLGFKELYLAEACMPRVNIEYGCKYLKRCLDLNREEEAGITRYKAALALYNGKRNHHNSTYDEDVLSHLATGAYKNVLIY